MFSIAGSDCGGCFDVLVVACTSTVVVCMITPHVSWWGDTFRGIRGSRVEYFSADSMVSWLAFFFSFSEAHG